MTLKGIKQYIDWFREGDATLAQRLEMFKRQKQQLEEQLTALHAHMKKIDYKIRLYGKAVKLGSLAQAQADVSLKKEGEELFGH